MKNIMSVLAILASFVSFATAATSLELIHFTPAEWESFRLLHASESLGSTYYGMNPQPGQARLGVTGGNIVAPNLFEDFGPFATFRAGDSLDIEFRFGPDSGQFSTFGFGNTIDLTGVVPVGGVSPNTAVFVVNSTTGLNLDLKIGDQEMASMFMIRTSDGSPLPDFIASVSSNPNFGGSLADSGFAFGMYSIAVPEPVMLGPAAVTLALATWRGRRR